MKTVKFLAVSSLLVTLYSPVARASVLCDSPAAAPPCVAAGTDYFQTQPGTAFMGIPLMGVPIVGSPISTADTIIERTSDALLNAGPQNILLMTGLSLESTAPVNLAMFGGAGFADLFVTLDPGNLANDTGTADIMGSLAGGTFNSTLDVFFDLCAGGDSGTGVGCGANPLLTSGSLALSQSGALWGPVPAPGDAIDLGPYVDSANPYNQHTGLPSNIVDFFVVGTLTENGPSGNGPGDIHVVDPAPSPEPASLSMTLLGAVLLGLGGWKKKNSLKKN